MPRWSKILLIVLGALAVILVVADRVAVRVAQDHVAQRLSEHQPFTGKPDVRIHGIPFLTQAFSGNYRDVEVSGSGLAIGNLRNVGFDAHLRGVNARLGDVLRDQIITLPVHRAEGEVTVPYDELAGLTGISGLTLKRSGDRVAFTAPVQLPVMGEQSVSGTVAATVHDRSLNLAFTITDAAGVAVPRGVLDQAGKLLNVTIPLPSLPYSLKVTGVSPTKDGVRVSGAATDVVLVTTT